MSANTGSFVLPAVPSLGPSIFQDDQAALAARYPALFSNPNVALSILGTQPSPAVVQPSLESPAQQPFALGADETRPLGIAPPLLNFGELVGTTEEAPMASGADDADSWRCDDSECSYCWLGSDSEDELEPALAAKVHHPSQAHAQQWLQE